MNWTKVFVRNTNEFGKLQTRTPNANPVLSFLKPYDVFISYSRKDIVFARALEKALEDYAPPKDLPVPQRRLVVFRDEEDLTRVEYNRCIREHLENSAKMLVICSPNARASDFVSDEIRLFAEKRGDQNIIPVLLSGIPNNEAHQPEHEEQKAFPQCLREVMSMPLADSFTDQEVKPMPLAASFIDLDPARDKLYKGVFKGPWYTVLANIYGVPRSDIGQRDRTRKKRQRRITTALVAGIIAALIVALIQRKEAVSQRELAEKARDESEGLIEFMVLDLRDKLEPIGRLDLLDSVNQHVNNYYQSRT
jgi:hypothetical protein